jgi:hypothetical protein
MKIAKIMGVMLIACVTQNVQSMEPEPAYDEFSVDRQFLEGNISPNDYLSYIASLSGDYAYKIRDLRNVQAFIPEASYEVFLSRLAMYSTMAQQVLASGDITMYKEMVESIRNEVLEAIDTYCGGIKRGGAMRHGKLS